MKISILKLSLFLLILIAISTWWIAVNTKEDGLEKISLRLKWVNQAQFSGYYSANTENYYKEVGLDVSIEPAGPNISPIQMVATGVNDFGVVGADQILLAREKGIPVVALAVLYKENPESLVSLKEKDIKSPRDLEGKTVAVIYGNDEIVYRAYLAMHGVDMSKIIEVAAVPDIIQVLSGQVDAKMAYEMNDAVLLGLKGKDTNLLRFRDDVKFYADTLFTTEKMINEQPELVMKFVTATIKGWKFAISHQERTIQEVIKINPNLNYEHQLKYLQSSIPILGDINDLGVSKKEVWKDMQEMLIKGGVMKERIDIDRVYTNNFLNND